MQLRPIGLITLIVAYLFAAPSSASEKIVVTTLNWQPYTGSSLPNEGATTNVLRKAFESAGFDDVEVVFVPWKRAIAMAEGGAEAVAYFPGYHCQHREGFIASEPIGHGPLGFAEHVEAPISWQSIDDLGDQQLKIGTVLGYANTAEFDEKAGTGWIRAISAKDDITNLKKLLRKRLDAVVIDKLVLSYLLATDPSMEGALDKIQFNEKPLEEKTLYLCFFDNDKGLALRDQFNAGLAKIDIDETVESYFADVF